MASGHEDSQVKIWNINSGKCLHTLIGHHGRINCLEYLADKYLISGSDDGTMKLWNLEDGNLINTLTRKPSKLKNISLSIYCMKLLDSERIACGSGNLSNKVR